MTDAIWEFAEHCWVKDPQKRPIASTLCDHISYLLKTDESITQSAAAHTCSIETDTEHAAVVHESIKVDEDEVTTKIEKVEPAAPPADSNDKVCCNISFQ